MLLVVSGERHRPRLNEPLVMPRWEEVFSLVTGEPLNACLSEHCLMVLTFRSVNFEDFVTEDMVEAASRFDVEKCVELAMEKFASSREEVVEFDVLPHQVAAATVLSKHELVKVVVSWDSATFSKRRRLSPLEILRTVYSKPLCGASLELRLTVGTRVWSQIKAASSLQNLKPEDCLAVLRGDKEKQAELLNLLKAKAVETRR
jgi:hypothetical protein